MIIKRFVFALVTVYATTFSLNSNANLWPFGTDKRNSVSGEIIELKWDDLIPKDIEGPKEVFGDMTQNEVDKLLDGSEESEAELERLIEQFQNKHAPSVLALDGKRVKIRAFITPLEFDSRPDNIKEFLLVPTQGAFLHTEPMWSNQAIYAVTKKPIEFPGMLNSVWVIGTVRTEITHSNLGEAGYLLEIEKLWLYE